MSETTRSNTFPTSAAWLGTLLHIAGLILCVAAAIYFFAWNWHTLPDALKFSLTAGDFLACLTLSLVAEYRNRPLQTSCFLFAACMFIGMFWAVFGQIFQSGATEREFCLVWAASMTPFLLLRPGPILWNLWVILVVVAALPDASPGYSSDFCRKLLPSTLLCAILCGISLLPRRFLRASGRKNSWLLLPLTLLLIQAGLLSFLLIFSSTHDVRTSPEVLAGPALLFIVLILAMHRHYAPALYELALTGLVLLNSLLARLALESSAVEPTSWILLFAVFNIAYTVFLVRFLPRAVRPSEQRPPSAQMSPNIPQADVRQSQLSPARPLLFPTILTGLGGFLSAIFLIALNILLFSASSDAAYLALGCIHTTAGAFLWHVRGRSVFLLTLAPVLIAAGVVFFQFGGDFLPVPLFIACVWAAGLVLYARLKNAPLRFGLTLWTLGNTFIQGICSLPAEFVAPAAQLFGLFCFLPIITSAWGRKLPAALRPAAFACVCVLIALTPLFKDATPFLIGLPEAALLSDLLLRSLGTTALVLLMRRFLLQHREKIFPHIVLLLSAVCALGFIWYFVPAETLLALTLIFVGKSAHPAENETQYDVPLFSVGLLLFAASLVFFYYHLALPFSAKALSMGLPGICLLFGGTILSHYALSPDNTSRPAPGVSSSRLPRNKFLRRAAPLIAAGVLLPLLFSLAVSDRRELLRDGRQILLALVPRDPRAFILGDYMELRYEVEQNLLVEDSGCLPLSIDGQGIAQSIPEHFMQGKTCRDVPFPALYLEPDLLSVRLRLPHRYYFEEGLAPLYENARYAALRCDERNACLLEGLADADGQLIEN